MCEREASKAFSVLCIVGIITNVKPDDSSVALTLFLSRHLAAQQAVRTKIYVLNEIALMLNRRSVPLSLSLTMANAAVL